MKKPKILYVDMDDVLADFYHSARHPIKPHVQEEKMFNKNFFLNLRPVPGSKSGIFQLQKMGFDIWVLTQPFVLVPESYIEKAHWIQLHFPQLSHKLIMTQDKGLHHGHYLVDDNPNKWKDKFENNGGKFIHFAYGGYNLENQNDPENMWSYIVDLLKKENPYQD